MLKKVIQGAVVGAAMFGLVGAAAATDYQINLFGASAQYLYWNDAADNFLSSVKGCTTTTQAQDTDKKNGITTGSGCTGGHTYTIRYSAKASYDGILSLKGDKTYAGSGGCNAGDTTCDGGTVLAGQEGFYRKMACTTAAPDTLKCVKVNLGASDVAGSSFVQESHGCVYGPSTTGAPNCTGSNWVDRVFTGIDTTGLASAQPLIVPFGFFANNCITKTKCLAPDPTEGANAPQNGHKAVSSWGNQCWDPDNDGHSQDCVGYYKCIDKVCAGGVNKGLACDEVTDCPDVALSATSCVRIPIDNVSRLMVTQIYNGQAVYWQDFGLWWDGNCDPQAPGTDFDPIVSCLRHAGSGTHATFDIFMKGNGWGLGSPINQSAGEPIVWFNDGSSDLMKCVNALPGAIGYADCDQLVGTKAKSGQDFPYENVHAVKLDGIECKRAKIRNGEYPFYSANWNFWRSTDPEAGLIGDLIAYASDPDNLPVGKRDYWAAKSEMVFLKGSDTAWPVFVGASEPQIP